LANAIGKALAASASAIAEAAKPKLKILFLRHPSI
jgi:hypothetical protein